MTELNYDVRILGHQEKEERNGLITSGELLLKIKLSLLNIVTKSFFEYPLFFFPVWNHGVMILWHLAPTGKNARI